MACAKTPPTHGELVARRFGARAAQYDDHALLQRESAGGSRPSSPRTAACRAGAW